MHYKGEKYRIDSYTKGAVPLANAFWYLDFRGITKSGRQWHKVANLDLRQKLARKFPPKQTRRKAKPRKKQSEYSRRWY